MRDIKFRGKAIVSGIWVHGAGVYTYGDKAWIIFKFGNNAMHHEEVDPATVGQLSEYQDKYGDYIYDGDIIRVQRKSDTILVVCKYGVIKRQMSTGFLVDICGFYFERDDGAQTFPITNNYAGVHDSKMFIKIGNTTENPELLKTN